VIAGLIKGPIQPFLGVIDLTIYLFMITFLSILIRSIIVKQLSVPDFKFNLLIVLLIIILGFSLLYSPLKDYGLNLFLRFLFLGLSLLYAVFMWCTNINRIKITLIIFCILSITYGLVSFLWTFILSQESLVERALFPNTPILAIAWFLAAGILSTFILKDLLSKKYLKLLIYILIVVIIVELIALASRGPLIAFIVAAASLFALYIIRKKKKEAIVIFGSIVATIVFSLILLPSQYTSRYFLTGTASSSIAIRIDMLLAVINNFTNWFLGGAGLGGFAALGIGNYPHNIFLEIFTHAGFFALLIFCLIIGLIVYRGVKLCFSSDNIVRIVATAIFISFVVYLTGHLFSGDITSTRPLWFFTGLILALKLVYTRDFASKLSVQQSINTNTIK
jgi:hypothetical protein